MNLSTVQQNPMTLTIRWLARLWSVASLGLLLLFFIGEGFNPTLITPAEWVGLFFFPFGIAVGMIVAWRREGLGGAITVGSLLAFYAWQLASGDLPRGPYFALFAAPGFLFLLSASLARRKR
jgi:hypothetical protein